VPGSTLSCIKRGRDGWIDRHVDSVNDVNPHPVSLICVLRSIRSCIKEGRARGIDGCTGSAYDVNSPTPPPFRVCQGQFAYAAKEGGG